jgi:hypothetical protein
MVFLEWISITPSELLVNRGKWSELLKGQEIFSFRNCPDRLWRATQSPDEWVSWAFPSKVVAIYSHIVPAWEMGELTPSPHILYAVVVNKNIQKSLLFLLRNRPPVYILQRHRHTPSILHTTEVLENGSNADCWDCPWLISGSFIALRDVTLRHPKAGTYSTSLC